MRPTTGSSIEATTQEQLVLSIGCRVESRCIGYLQLRDHEDRPCLSLRCIDSMPRLLHVSQLGRLTSERPLAVHFEFASLPKDEIFEC